MNVLLLSRYGRLAPNSRLRSYQYLPFLKTRGIRVDIAPFSSDRYLRGFYAGAALDRSDVARSYARRISHLLKSRRYDLLWIEHELLPWFPAWGEALLRRLDVPYMADFDDAVFHRYDLHRLRAVRWALGNKIDRVMRSARLVIAGNRYLADRAAGAGAEKVAVLPTVVDFERYGPASSKTREGFTVGWIGTPTNVKYLRLARAALGELSRRGGARVVLVGSGPVPFTFPGVTVREWSEETEVAEIQAFDAGIMPLADDPWTRGKCGYKLIQYMACALPVVASAVGANREIVEHGKTGFLVSTPAEWTAALKTLRDNPGLRMEMGQRGRDKVKKHYSLRVTAPKLGEMIAWSVGSRNFRF